MSAVILVMVTTAGLAMVATSTVSSLGLFDRPAPAATPAAASPAGGSPDASTANASAEPAPPAPPPTTDATGQRAASAPSQPAAANPRAGNSQAAGPAAGSAATDTKQVSKPDVPAPDASEAKSERPHARSKRTRSARRAIRSRVQPDEQEASAPSGDNPARVYQLPDGRRVVVYGRTRDNGRPERFSERDNGRIRNSAAPFDDEPRPARRPPPRPEPFDFFFGGADRF